MVSGRMQRYKSYSSRYRSSAVREMRQGNWNRAEEFFWGSLVGVDLAAGEIRWSVPTGHEDGVDGITNFGPALITAGGLVFHAGTRELALRAHDIETGEVLARFEIPAGLHGGPISYKLRPDGKQYLVIAPGGHVGLRSKQGDYVIAYTLP